ncbi:hypothetical protein, partial [Acinetobacter baumannii]|uniref:hypothetical protein n=1 Tax=Acinetobacter baumannii TaxID=470 RepID=UPI00189C2405
MEGVRHFIRDVIADLVVWIGTKTGPGAMSLAVDLPDMVSRKIPRTRQVFEWLTSSMSALSNLIGKVGSALASLIVAGKKAIAHAPLTVRPISEWRLPRSIVLNGIEAGLGVVARAEDDARNRPPEPSASRVPHSAR